MAIVINGSGTVTGLAVGGLPDGTVDDGTVASGIASSKLTGALPAISGASLTGFTDAQMPAGSVLQVVSATFGTSTSSTTTSWVNTPITASITPTSTSSKILISVNTPVWVASAGTYAGRTSIFRGTSTGTNLGHSALGFANIWNADSTGSGDNAGMSYLDSPSTTSSQAYTVCMRSEGNSSLITVMDSGTKATITLQEIAG